MKRDFNATSAPADVRVFGPVGILLCAFGAPACGAADGEHEAEVATTGLALSVEDGVAAEHHEEGTIEALVQDDFAAKTSRMLYFLKTSTGKKLKLELPGGAPPVRPGQVVRVHGKNRGDTFTIAASGPGGGVEMLQAPAASMVAASLGPKKLIVLMSKYSDDPNPPAFSEGYVRGRVFTDYQSPNAFYQEMSRNQVSLTGIQRSDGDVHGYYNVSRSAGCFGATAEAEALATQQGINLDAYDHIMHFIPGFQDNCGPVSQADLPGRRSYMLELGYGILAHELGHNFGLHHANAWVCTEAGSIPVTLGLDQSCFSDDYDDPFDPMGIGAGQLSDFHKWKLGYIPAQNERAWTEDGDFTIVPTELSSTSGIQSLRVPRPSSTDVSTAYFNVEFRQPLGRFDSVYPANHPVVNGVSVRVTASTTDPWLTPSLIDMTPETPGAPDGYGDSALLAGKAFYDPSDHYVFHVLSVSSAGANVRVLGNRPATRINFQPAGLTPPAGYLVDDGSAYGMRSGGLSYGWNADNKANARDRNSPETPGGDQRYDTLNHMQKSGGGSVWEVAVPNGSYWVRLGVGDVNTDSIYKIAVEGVLTVNETPTATSKWFQRTALVNVQDGKLTVSNTMGSANNKINFIEFVSASPGAPVFTANFDATVDGFAYGDNLFRGATQGNYAAGSRLTSGGVNNTGAVQVSLGGVDNVLVNGISGGWQRTFNLTAQRNVTVTFTYNLSQSQYYESDELSHMLASIDGRLVGTRGSDFVAQVQGDGDGGLAATTGWKTVTLNLGLLGAGNHTLTLGGYNNKKTQSTELTDVRIDNVAVRTY